MILENRIRQYRTAAGESVAELAKSLNVCYAAVGHWENGIRSPRDNMKVKIAAHYGVPVEKIFFINESTNSGGKENHEKAGDM